jgi:sugar phosphate permease
MNTNKISKNKNSKVLIALLTLTYLIIYMIRFTNSSATPFLLKDSSQFYTRDKIVIIGSIFAITYAIFKLIWGFGLIRFAGHKALAGLLVVTFLAFNVNIYGIVTQNVNLMYFAALIYGITMASGAPYIYSVITNSFTKIDYAKTIGIVFGISGLGSVIDKLLFTLDMNYINVIYLLDVVVLILTIIVVVGLLSLKQNYNIKGKQKEINFAIKEMLTNKNIWLAIIVTVLSSVSMRIFSQWNTYYLTKVVSLPASNVNNIEIVRDLTDSMSLILWGYVLTKFAKGKLPLVIISNILLATLFWLYFSNSQLNNQTLTILVVAIALISTINAIAMPTYVVERISNLIGGSSDGLRGFISYLTIDLLMINLIFPVVIGDKNSENWQNAVLLFILINIVNIVLTLLIKEKRISK